MSLKRLGYTVWIILIVLFAAAHTLHLRADFPNFSPWEDWAKYTDEGWYGNAAIRAHLFGDWYVPGDFNPAPAVPVWPFLLWVLFFFTGVTVEAARALAVAFFFLNLFLSYKLFRERGPRWVGLLAVTLLVTSPFLYCFSRLAILEPLLMALTLGAMNLAVRLPQYERKEGVCALIGLIFTGMLLTKTTAVFLLPALVWMIALPMWNRKRKLARMLAAAGISAAVSFSLWMLLVVNSNLYEDYLYLFSVNKYLQPVGLLGRAIAFWWSFHGGLWADVVLIPLAGILILAALYTRIRARRLNWTPACWTNGLWRDPLFSGSVLAAAGYVAFMTYQNHPQPRYYVVVAFFSFFVVVRVTAQLLYTETRVRRIGLAVLALLAGTAAMNGIWSLRYALHPQYTWVTAANDLTRYIDEHPNGKRMVVSMSGDEITLISHLPALCDEFGTTDLDQKLVQYQPGWFASWNDLDPDTLADIHTHFSLEQVASFPAFDDPERNVLVLFKLHPLPHGEVRSEEDKALRAPMPEDSIAIPMEED